MKTQAEIEWDEKYGSMTEKEYKHFIQSSIGSKLESMEAKTLEEMQAQRDKYNLTYAEYSKAIADTRKRIKELDGKPEELKEKKRAELEVEYAEAKKYDRVPFLNSELWISEQLLKYMTSDEEYLATKSELTQAKKDLAIYLAKKEEWEEENADIIEAERYRTKRAELLSADDETLRALGIEPVKREPVKREPEKRFSYSDASVTFDDLLKQAVKDVGK